MDTLRSQFSGHGEWAERADIDAREDDTPHEPPPSPIGQDERRMQVRAYNFWASLLDSRNFPAVEDLDPDALPDFGPYSVLLDFTCGIEDPAIQYLGEKLAEECGAEGPIATLADVPSRSLLSRITDHYMQILANQAPIGFEAEFVNRAGATVLYRGILLPFSSDDDTIDFIYGVINWKELADQRTADELLLEIDQALEAGPEPVRSATPMPGWADGPADDGAILDLMSADIVPDQDEAALAQILPEPAFLSTSPAPATDAPASDMELADWLASARNLAQAVIASESRTREALYAAIGRAHDFALAAADKPGELSELLADAGIAASERAPLLPIARLVFGAAYDKTRLSEYATVLDHAGRNGVPRGGLAVYLAGFEGGLKALVKAERLARKGDAPASAPRSEPRKSLARKLRKLQPVPLGDLAPDGEEFTLLVARRTASGEVVLLGEVTDVPLLERAARKLIA